MKILVTGSRNYTNEAHIREVLLDYDPLVTTIIHGAAKGADSLADKVAKELGMEVIPYPADWAQYGKGAGKIRNREMHDVEKPDLVISFHEDLENSKGTKDMVDYSERQGTPVRRET